MPSRETSAKFPCDPTHFSSASWGIFSVKKIVKLVLMNGLSNVGALEIVSKYFSNFDATFMPFEYTTLSWNLKKTQNKWQRVQLLKFVWKKSRKSQDDNIRMSNIMVYYFCFILYGMILILNSWAIDISQTKMNSTHSVQLFYDLVCIVYLDRQSKHKTNLLIWINTPAKWSQIGFNKPFVFWQYHQKLHQEIV